MAVNLGYLRAYEGKLFGIIPLVNVDMHCFSSFHRYMHVCAVRLFEIIPSVRARVTCAGRTLPVSLGIILAVCCVVGEAVLADTFGWVTAAVMHRLPRATFATAPSLDVH